MKFLGRFRDDLATKPDSPPPWMSMVWGPNLTIPPSISSLLTGPGRRLRSDHPQRGIRPANSWAGSSPSRGDLRFWKKRDEPQRTPTRVRRTFPFSNTIPTDEFLRTDN